MKGFIHKLLIGYFDRKAYKRFSSQFKLYLNKLGLGNLPCNGENEYMQKWKQLSKDVERYSYRLFSHYCGNDPNIVPEEVGHRKIETALNPLSFRAFYGDKNMYSLYLDKTCMPDTILRRVGGGPILSDNFTPPHANFIKQGEIIPMKYDKLILKPSIGTSSGKGIMLFYRDENGYISADGNIPLNMDFLYSYGDNFILQEGIKQHSYLSQFCPTSVNTLRIAVYRSVKDEIVHVIGSIMRIGKNGKFVDNAHSGGRFVGIDIKTGELGSYVCDQYGNKIDEWNEINFKNNNFVIPYWEEVIEFAKYVGKCNHHMRLLALDIALDEKGKPCLIEYNCDSFSYWLFMFTGKTPFGEYTDEIIDYCIKHPVHKVVLLI